MPRHYCINWPIRTCLTTTLREILREIITHLYLLYINDHRENCAHDVHIALYHVCCRPKNIKKEIRFNHLIKQLKTFDIGWNNYQPLRKYVNLSRWPWLTLFLSGWSFLVSTSSKAINCIMKYCTWWHVTGHCFA